MSRRATTAILLACVSLVFGGTAAEFVFLPRAVPKPVQTLKDSPPKVMSQEQMEGLLGRVAKSLDVKLRADLAQAVLAEAVRNGYDPLFVLALVAVESSFRVHVSSDRGAAGLMQLKPSTFAWISAREPDIGGDDSAVAEDPVIDVRLAVRYFHWLEKRFHSRDDALMAYNAGPRKLSQYKQAGEIPATLREYPQRVMKQYQRFVRLTGGGADSQNLLIAKAN